MTVSSGLSKHNGERSARHRGLSLLESSGSVRRTVTACILHILLVWSMVWLVVEHNYQRAAENWKASAETIALAVAQHASQAQGSADLIVKSMVHWIAEQHIETEQQFREIMGEKRFFDIMRDRIVGQPQIGVAMIIAANGDIVNATRVWPPAANNNVADREAFRMAIEPNAPTISATSYGRLSGRPRFFISRKVLSSTGDLLGVVAVGLEADFFAAFYKQMAPGPDSALALFRDDGTLLPPACPIKSWERASTRRCRSAWSKADNPVRPLLHTGTSRPFPAATPRASSSPPDWPACRPT